ncbi:MAG TPA: zf-HC2 domain-containing protein [Nitrospiria bacterium]
MDHDRLKEQLLMLYDGELSGTEAQEAADHLRSCPACRKEYADWERIARAFFKAPQVHMSSHFVRKVMKRIETLERPAGKKHPSLLRWLVPAMGMGFIVGIFTWSSVILQPPQVSIEALLLTNGRDTSGSQWIFQEEGPRAQDLLTMALEEQ